MPSNNKRMCDHPVNDSMLCWVTIGIELTPVGCATLNYKGILNHKLFQSCNTRDYESISPKLQFGELNHIVAEYHYKCNRKIRFYFHVLEFADYTYSLFFLEYVSCVVLFVWKCVKLVFINFFSVLDFCWIFKEKLCFCFCLSVQIYL